MFNAISAEAPGQTPDSPQRISPLLTLGNAQQVVATDVPYRVALPDCRAVVLHANLGPVRYALGNSIVSASDTSVWLEPGQPPHTLWLPAKDNYLSVVRASSQDSVLELSYMQVKE